MTRKYCSAGSYKNAKANPALKRTTLAESCILLILTSWTRQNYGPPNSSNMNSLTVCHKQICRLVFNCIFWFLSDRFPYYAYMGSYHIHDNNIRPHTQKGASRTCRSKCWSFHPTCNCMETGHILLLPYSLTHAIDSWSVLQEYWKQKKWISIIAVHFNSFQLKEDILHLNYQNMNHVSSQLYFRGQLK